MDVKKTKPRTRKPKTKLEPTELVNNISSLSTSPSSIIEINSIDPIMIHEPLTPKMNTIINTIEHKKIEDIMLEHEYPFTPTSTPVVSDEDQNNSDMSDDDNQLKTRCNSETCDVIMDSTMSKEPVISNQITMKKTDLMKKLDKPLLMRSQNITYDTLLERMGIKVVKNELIITPIRPKSTVTQLKYKQMQKYIQTQQRMKQLQQLKKQTLVISSYDNHTLNNFINNDKLFRIKGTY